MTAYSLNALVGEASMLAHTGALPAIGLVGQKVLVPLSDAYWRSVGHWPKPLLRTWEARHGPDFAPDEREHCLRQALAASAMLDGLCQAASSHLLVYVEAETFGGVGNQAACAWERGELVFGPIVARDAINQALERMLGPSGQGGGVHVLGLHRYRTTEGWLERETFLPR